jgi:hypothetical protein
LLSFHQNQIPLAPSYACENQHSLRPYATSNFLDATVELSSCAQVAGLPYRTMEDPTTDSPSPPPISTTEDVSPESTPTPELSTKPRTLGTCQCCSPTGARHEGQWPNFRYPSQDESLLVVEAGRPQCCARSEARAARNTSKLYRKHTSIYRFGQWPLERCSSLTWRRYCRPETTARHE